MIPEFTPFIQASTPAVRPAFKQIISTFNQGLPSGFAPAISYGMVAFVVPLAIYSAGYHCNPSEPLPFVSIAARKDSISLYHMGLYAHRPLLQWFTENWANHTHAKLDMGKSCIRFKKVADIPYDLLETLAAKMSVQDWIDCYENQIKR